MARVTKETCKLCRREGKKLFLKGEKCNSGKCPFTRRSYGPGVHGMSRRRAPSGYALALREKQKVKRTYGVLEKQFRNYFDKADRKEGITGEVLLQLLETRLDVVVYRMGFAPSLRQARQLVNHGHFTVNGTKVDIPSYSVRASDKIEVSKRSKKDKYFEALKDAKKEIPDWVKVDMSSLKGELTTVPLRKDLDQEINEQLIVELYSK